VFGELVDELSELGFIDVEAALGRDDEIFFDIGFEIEKFAFKGVGPVIRVLGFSPQVEGVIFDCEAEFFLGCFEVEPLI